MPPSIGILGGVGAIASARFHLDLVTAWAARRGAKTDDDFPRIVHLSQSLGLSSEGLTDKVTQADILYELTRECFEGLDHLAVVCNSITPFVPTPRELPGILTPVAACREALRGVSRAWLVASESTIRDQIYQRAYPHIDWKPRPVTAQIQQALSGRMVSDPFELDGSGDLPIVLGCTELSTAHLHWPDTISPTDEMIRILCL